MPNPLSATARALAIAAATSLAGTAAAQTSPPLQLTIKDHRFSPAEIHVPAGKATFLMVNNADATPEEFESGILAIEKVVVGGGRIRVRLPPLAPGRYPFFGDFHPDTAQGAVIADPPAAK